MREQAERVAGIAYAIAAAMKLGDSEIRTIPLGGLLHEIAKLDIPDAILFKRDWMMRKRVNALCQLSRDCVGRSDSGTPACF